MSRTAVCPGQALAWFPMLVVTDNAGRFVGIARLDRPIGRLAANPPAPSA